ncbi:type VI secretion protein ImpA [Pseudomonas endophytica]|uniref:Type VI secretion protein ImpA n=1 Tax=Pseudomonas endophytica TaxID=1563157 RepID=A0A0Q0XCR8_9PSED|nr:type VI secretion system protein TssA [Pseudomonas endophytica]KQB55384.1 type VI secretion protein ImpA [Pseudomonas endophytica]
MTYSSQLFARLVALAKAPVFKDSFAGNDVRFSSQFEALEREIGKSQSMSENNQIDWYVVHEQSEAMLRDQSKDLRAGVWLTWALYQRESFPGLLAGLGLLHHLCTEHWEQIHPLKLRTRGAAIGWLVGRLDRALNENVPIKEQLPLFQHMVELLLALECALAKHLGADVPLLLPICRRLTRMVERAVASQPETGVIAAAVAQVKQVAIQLIDPTPLIDNEKEAHKALRQQQDSARALCGWWLKQKATDLRALRLNRTLTWLPIDFMPERNAEQITPLRSVCADKLKNYQGRFNQGQFADLVVELEVNLAKSAFWFDGQRMVWECLNALKAESAMYEVELHLALLLQRLPGLIELRFSDGAPFADPQTRTWIDANVLPHLTRSEPEAAQASTERPAWDLALDEAQELLRVSGFKASVQLIKRGLNSAYGERVRFFWQLALARLCFHAKKYELAKTQLEMLDEVLHRSGLQTWEPDLVLEVLRLLHRCCELLPQNHEVRERKDEMYRRLCHLDLEVVLE